MRALRRCSDTSVTPHRLLEHFEWGCGIVSCIDIDDPLLRVVRFDPGFELEDEAEMQKAAANSASFCPTAPAFATGVDSRMTYCFQRETDSLQAWFALWLEGHSALELQRMLPQRALLMLGN